MCSLPCSQKVSCRKKDEVQLQMPRCNMNRRVITALDLTQAVSASWRSGAAKCSGT